MPKQKRVFLAGFRTLEFQEFRRLGVDIEAFIQLRERGDAPYETGVETYPHFETVRCDIELSSAIEMSAALKRELYGRAFPMFRRHYSRTALPHGSAMRSWLNIENIFFISALFYYNIIAKNKIDCVVFPNFPHESSFIILYQLARILNIETVICCQSNFPGQMWVMRDIEDFGTFATVWGGGTALPTPGEPEIPFYMGRPSRLRHKMRTSGRIASETAKLLTKVVTLKAFFDHGSIDRNMNRLMQARDSWSLGDPVPYTVPGIDLDRPFVYFPLHLQPEMTTDTLGLDYADQLLAIEELAAALPEGVLIYAKENPAQTRFMRDDSFYRRMRLIANLRYVSPDTPSFELIRRSRCVATISGTAGWEAALIGKGAIHFGVTWYSSLPGVFRWQGPETLQLALAYRNDRALFEKGFEALSRKLYPGIVDPVYAAIMPGYDKQREARKVAGSLALVLSER